MILVAFSQPGRIENPKDLSDAGGTFSARCSLRSYCHEADATAAIPVRDVAKRRFKDDVEKVCRATSVLSGKWIMYLTERTQLFFLCTSQLTLFSQATSIRPGKRLPPLSRLTTVPSLRPQPVLRKFPPPSLLYQL